MYHVETPRPFIKHSLPHVTGFFYRRFMGFQGIPQISCKKSCNITINGKEDYHSWREGGGRWCGANLHFTPVIDINVQLSYGSQL